MADIFNNFLKQIARGDQVRDFKHASRIFVDNNYRLSPKSSWIYHVFFDLNPQVCNIKDNARLIEHGMLVKAIDLPKFSIQSKVFNEYNRPNIVQTKVNYDTVSITFHDDMANVIRGFWADYFTYYYRDTDIGYSSTTGQVNPIHQTPSLYTDTQRDILNRFGYSPRSFDAAGEQQYINAIRIYSLHQKRFSEYTLVNPMIVSFNHGQHDTRANDGMESNMTVIYETMLYGSGYVTPATVRGFADLHYDKSPSPLTPQGGGTNSILGPGGILSAVDEIVKSGATGTAQGFGAAAFTLFRAFEKNKNVDLKGLAKAEIIQAATDILSLRNPADRFFIPTRGSLTNNNFPGLQTNPRNPNPAPSGATSNGTSLSGVVATAAAAGLSGIPVPSVAAATAIAAGAFISSDTGQNLITNIKGAVSGTGGKLAGGSLNQVYNVDINGAVTSSVPQQNPSFLNSAVQKDQASLRSTSSLLSETSSAGAVSAVAFVTGTSEIAPITAGQAQASILGQTAYAPTVIPPSATTAAAGAKEFLDTGAITQLTPTTPFTGGTSTPPAPSSIG